MPNLSRVKVLNYHRNAIQCLHACTIIVQYKVLPISPPPSASLQTRKKLKIKKKNHATQGPREYLMGTNYGDDDEVAKNVNINILATLCKTDSKSVTMCVRWMLVLMLT